MMIWEILCLIWVVFDLCHQLGVFEMSHSGLQAVSNASEMFLSEQHLDSKILAGLAVAAIMDGSRTFLIEIQVIFFVLLDFNISNILSCQPHYRRIRNGELHWVLFM